MSRDGLFLLIIFSPVVLYFFYKYLIKINERRKWAKIKSEDFPSAYENVLERSFRPYRFLSEEERQRLNQKIIYFLRDKRFVSIGEFQISEEMKLIVAAQACLLIVNLDVEIYPSLTNIYLSAATFTNKDNFIDYQTMQPAHAPRLGESWKDGPIILSWSSVAEGVQDWRDGENVVLHEFVHQLDGHEGGMNGVPSLHSATSYDKWKILMSKEFFDLREKLIHHQHTDIDDYASKNPSEFFAVTVEEFFERSVVFKNKHPELFKLYESYFNINPLKWH